MKSMRKSKSNSKSKIKSNRFKELANDFLELQLQTLAIAEELESEEMLMCAIATSEAFLNRLEELKFYSNPYEDEIYEAKRSK